MSTDLTAGIPPLSLRGSNVARLFSPLRSTRGLTFLGYLSDGSGATYSAGLVSARCQNWPGNHRQTFLGRYLLECGVHSELRQVQETFVSEPTTPQSQIATDLPKNSVNKAARIPGDRGS